METKSLILLEDDVNLRQSISLLLQHAGYLVAATGSVGDAIDWIQTGRYHLIITDINMPDSRRGFLPQFERSFPCLSIVILTDFSESDLNEEEKLLRAHYLIKPIPPENLLENIKQILEKEGQNHHI